MDGFKNSTRTQYMKGGSCDGYAKGGSVKGAAKISKVMGEFKRGDLHSGSNKGPKVTSEKQATAIALSEARKVGAKIPVKKFDGGGVFNERGQRATWDEVAAEGRRVEGRKRPVEGISTRPTDSSGRRITDKELGITPGGAAPAKKPRTGAKTPQPVQKKSLGGILKAVSPAAAILSGEPEKLFGGMGAIGLAAKLMKKKQSGQPLTPAESQQLAQSQQGQTAMKKGGMAKKGVPVASKKPLIGGLAAMPKGKKY